MHTRKIFFYILIRSRKTFDNFDKCINSVLLQNYKNIKILFVDDASGYSQKQKKYMQKKLKGHVALFNKIRRYSVYNAYHLIHKYAINDNAIVINLDGDDWLLPGALKTISAVYKKHPNCQSTYGECLIWDGKNILTEPSRFILPNTNIPYSKKVINESSYRLEPFLPLHPRTWKVKLFKSIAKKEFLDSRGKWLRFAEDQVILFPMLEKINGNYKIIKKPIYVYNRANIHADVTENTIPLLKDEIEIRRKHSSVKKYVKNKQMINIYHHKALSLPIVGNLIYSIQIKSLKTNLISNLFFSSKKNILINDLLMKSLVKTTTVVVKTAKLSALIKGVNNYKILELQNVDLNKMNISYLYDLMWTLVYCDAVTNKTRHAIEKILPSNYPTIKV